MEATRKPKVRVAAIQFASCETVEQNVEKAVGLVRQAAGDGANIILLQELFTSRYFPIDQIDCTELAIRGDDGNTFLKRFQHLSKELGVVLPVSFFEECNTVYFNAIRVFDSDGTDLGTYRKSHIPDGPGYQEKFYFTAGQGGFRTFDTKYGRIGVAICWDQWFPEAARCMVLRGAQLLLYPTAIGSEPSNAGLDSRAHWMRCIQGHAAANMVPCIVANRVGREQARSQDVSITFYGSSFMTDQVGARVATAATDRDQVVAWDFDLEAIKRERVSWGLFRDRRPDLYGAICTLDGDTA